MYGMPTLRFKLGRWPVEIELFHFLGAAILGISQTRGSNGLLWLLLWIVVVVVSVVLHELGHAFALSRMGRSAAITLHGMGGVTTHDAALTPRQNIAVHLAGPLPMLLLIGIPARWWFWNGSFSSDLLLRLAYDLYMVNFWWSIINLLPLWPLDGGQILGSITEIRQRNGNWRLVHWVSVSVALVGGVWSYSENRDNAYILLFGLLLAVQNFMMVQNGRAPMLHPGYQGSLATGGYTPPPQRSRGGGMGGRFGGSFGGGREHREPRAPKAPKPSKAKAPERLARGYALLAQGNSDGARREAELVLETKTSPDIANVAGEIVAWSYLQERNVPKARAAIAVVPDRSKVSKCLLASFEITGTSETNGLKAVAEALVDEPEGPSNRQVIDYVGRRGLGVGLAEQLLALPNGRGFEAAVRSAAVLADCGRREQAARVQEMVFGG